MADQLTAHPDLGEWQRKIAAAMPASEFARQFAITTGITDAERRCAYEPAFVGLTGRPAGARLMGFTQFAVERGSIDRSAALACGKRLERVMATLVGMVVHPDKPDFATPPTQTKKSRRHKGR